MRRSKRFKIYPVTTCDVGWTADVIVVVRTVLVDGVVRYLGRLLGGLLVLAGMGVMAWNFWRTWQLGRAAEPMPVLAPGLGEARA